jgi:hypothetical protein
MFLFQLQNETTNRFTIISEESATVFKISAIVSTSFAQAAFFHAKIANLKNAVTNAA